MSYYKGEEVVYRGLVEIRRNFANTGRNLCHTDIDGFSFNTVAGSYNVQYVGSFSVKKGDIIYFSDSENFPQGGYFKASINYEFTSGFSSDYDEVEAELYEKIYKDTAYVVLGNGSSIVFDYLGESFDLSQLTDEEPTPEPTAKPTESVGDEEVTTLYDFSTIKVDIAGEIIENADFTVTNLLISVVPIAFIGFAVVYGLKRAVSYFKNVAGGKH